MPIQPSPMPSSAVASAIRRPAAGVARAARPPRRRAGASRRTPSCTSTMQFSCRQSVSLFMVAGAEAEHRVAGGGQQRAGVVHAEVATRVAEDDRRLPRLAARRRPQDAAHERAVGLTRGGSTRGGRRRPGSSSAAASSRARTAAGRRGAHRVPAWAHPIRASGGSRIDALHQRDFDVDRLLAAHHGDRHDRARVEVADGADQIVVADDRRGRRPTTTMSPSLQASNRGGRFAARPG